LGKATNSFGIFFCPSICTNGATQRTPNKYHEILFLNIFRKSVEKIQVSLKSDKNNGYFT